MIGTHRVNRISPRLRPPAQGLRADVSVLACVGSCAFEKLESLKFVLFQDRVDDSGPLAYLHEFKGQLVNVCKKKKKKWDSARDIVKSLGA